MIETKADAEAAFDAFIESCQVKSEKAAECLNKDRDAADGAGSLTAALTDLLRASAPDTVAAPEFGPSGLMRQKFERADVRETRVAELAAPPRVADDTGLEGLRPRSGAASPSSARRPGYRAISGLKAILLYSSSMETKGGHDD